MKRYEIKHKLKQISVGTWIFTGIMASFVILAIILLFVTMHLCGYNLLTWFIKFGGWLILVALLCIIGLATYWFNKFRKGM